MSYFGQRDGFKVRLNRIKGFSKGLAHHRFALHKVNPEHTDTPEIVTLPYQSKLTWAVLG